MVKIARLSVFPLAVGVATQLISFSASAASLYWDPLATGGAGGGSGLWDTGTVAWSSAAAPGTGTMSGWVDGNDAVFAGSTTPNSVVLNVPITVGSLGVSSPGYTITTFDTAPLAVTAGITVSAATGTGTIDGSGLVNLVGNQTVSVTSAFNISAPLSGSGLVTKTGTGSLGLAGFNGAFTGKFLVTGGFLGVNADTVLGAVPVSFQADNVTLDGGTLAAGVNFTGPTNFQNPGSVTLDANRGITLGAAGGSFRIGFGAANSLIVNGAISGPGGLTKVDSGTLVLAADNSYLGETSIIGVLQIGNGGSTGTISPGKITFANGNGNGNFLNFNRTGNVVLNNDITAISRANISAISGETVTINGAITAVAPGELWTHGTGIIIVNANPNSSRNTSNVVESGTLRVSDLTRNANSALGSGNIYLGQGSTPSTGAGLSYTGDTIATDAFQNIQSPYAFIEVTKPETTLSITSVFKANSVAAGQPTNLLTKLGAGTLSLEGSGDNTRMRVQVEAGTLQLAKASSGGVHAVGGTDAIIQNGGTIRITGTGGDQIYDPSSVQIHGGTFDLNGQTEGFNVLNGTGGVITNNVATTTSTLTLGTNNGSSVYGGKIQDGAGALNLIKSGSGSLTLTGANVLTGGTMVTSGQLIVQGSLTGSETQVAGFLGGTGTVGDVSLSGGILSPGATEIGAGIGKLTLGNLSLVNGGLFEATLDTSTLANSWAEIHGDLSLGSSTASLTLTEFGIDTVVAAGTKFTIMSYTGEWDGGTFTFGGFENIVDEGTLTFGSNTYLVDYNAIGETSGVSYVTLTAVPEPGVTGLLVGGLGLLGGWRRRRTAARRS